MNEWYFALVFAGILLLAIEIFIPGGVLGALGAISLIAAIIIGFQFPPPWNWVSAAGITALSTVCLIIWLKYFPKTVIGRLLTLNSDGSLQSAANSKYADLENKTGIAVSDLKPSGIAMFDGRRVDVVADGYIEKDQPIRVISIRGNHVTVTEEQHDID